MGYSDLLLLKTELESSFGTENGAHSWLDVRAIGASFEPERQHHRRQEHQQRLTTHPGHVLGRRSAKLTFGHYLIGDGTALEEGESPSDDTLQGLLHTCLGGSYSDEGGLTDSGSTTTSLLLASGDGSNFAIGAAILVEDGGGSGIYEASVIADIDGDQLELEWALSNAPGATKKVVNGYASYIDPSNTRTQQFQWIGDDNADEFLALGCAGSIKLANLLGLEEPPVVNFEWQVAEWETDTATLAAGSYDGAAPLATSEEIEILFGDHGTTTRNRLAVSALEIEPGVSYEPLYARGNQDTQHIERFKMMRPETKVSMTPDVASSFLTDDGAQTAKRLTYIFGRTPGQTIVIDVPTLYYEATPKREEHASQLARGLTLAADEDDADTSTAFGRSPLRITRL